MKITKKEFDSLYSDDITKKEYDAIIAKIDERFNEIILILVPRFKNSNSGWFDYDNCSYDGEASGGYFNPKSYKNDIGIGGEWNGLPSPFDYTIPTRWLWEDFKEDFKIQVEAYNKGVEVKKIKAKEAAKNEKKKMKNYANL